MKTPEPGRRVLNDGPAQAAGLVVVGLAASALFAPWLAPIDPQKLDLGNLLATSSWSHPMGTDQIGRDVLSRLIHGARWSLGGALLVTVIVMVVGIGMGAISGFSRGPVDLVIMRLVDALLAFPSLILALAVVAAVGPGLVGVLIALASVGWAGHARVVRGLVLSLREREYVLASRAAGGSASDIICRHVVPHLVAPMVVLATLEVGQLILALAGLSFLGLGAQSPTPEWGVMINEGRAFLFRAPRLMVYPGIAITLTVLAFNVLGDRLRDILDPRLEPVANDVSACLRHGR